MKHEAYHLVTADNSNNREGLDTVLLGLEGDVAVLAAIVSKHHIGMNIGVEVIDSLAIALDSILKGSLALGIRGAVTAAVTTTLGTIAVNVHVHQLAVLSLEVHDAVVIEVITAVSKIWTQYEQIAGICDWNGVELITLGVVLLAVKATLQLIVARALGADRLIERAHVVGHLTAQSRGSQHTGKKNGGGSLHCYLMRFVLETVDGCRRFNFLHLHKCGRRAFIACCQPKCADQEDPVFAAIRMVAAPYSHVHHILDGTWLPLLRGSKIYDGISRV